MKKIIKSFILWIKIFILFVFTIPFAIIGFIFSFIKNSFEAGQGVDERLRNWIQKQ